MNWILRSNEHSWLVVFLTRMIDAQKGTGALPPKPTPETLRRHQKQVAQLLASILQEWNLHEKDLARILGLKATEYPRLRELTNRNYDFKDLELNTILHGFCELLENSRQRLENILHNSGYILWREEPQSFHIWIDPDDPKNYQKRVFGIGIPQEILEQEADVPF